MSPEGVRVLFRGLPSEVDNEAGEFSAALEEGATVADLLAGIASKAAGKARLVLDAEACTLRPEYLLTLNGRFLEKARFGSTVLEDGDLVEVFPVPTGG